jgi:hypothetical protein
VNLTTLLQVSGPLAMVGIAWKAIAILEAEVKGLRSSRNRHSNMLAVLFARLGLEPPPADE